MAETAIGWKIAEITGALVVEAALQAKVQQALNDDLDDGKKRVAAAQQIDEKLNEGIEKNGRLFFGLNVAELENINLTSSVAIEEVHSRYLTHCDLQTLNHQGAMYVVYGGRGMGKSVSSLSLLVHRHGRAPKRGIFFGGSTSFASGEEYFNFLIDDLLTGRKTVLKKLSELNPFTPDGLARTIADAVPVDKGDLTSYTRKGTMVIPGLQAFLKTPGPDGLDSKTGGSPVLVFEDVNIEISDPNPSLSKAQQRGLWFKELGKGGAFLDRIMIQSYERGLLTFVTTKNLNMAKFLLLLNDMEKAKPFKTFIDGDNYTCQLFAWDEAARERFLTLQNETAKDGRKLSKDKIRQLVREFATESIRDMLNAFNAERKRGAFPQISAAGISNDSQDDPKRGGGWCGMFSTF
mmetsp:Transcript_2180/g.5021  ORF Transcript_2180/g.5021 Transcript_2180/m.5021 type:complete len:406 (+) Transcript_2180:95-1312(+)